jgi:hypothetical protein
MVYTLDIYISVTSEYVFKELLIFVDHHPEGRQLSDAEQTRLAGVEQQVPQDFANASEELLVRVRIYTQDLHCYKICTHFPFTHAWHANLYNFGHGQLVRGYKTVSEASEALTKIIQWRHQNGINSVVESE